MMHARIFSFALIALALVSIGCEPSTEKSTDCEVGTEACPCAEDGTCATGLFCASGRCVRASLCGNGITDPGEACDDGRHCADGTACSEDTSCSGSDDLACRSRGGDGCSADCLSLEQCGNGIVDLLSGERCDEGAANSESPDAVCRTDCLPQRCGDGVVDTGEVCDAGDENSQVAGAACRTNCTPNRCGDGVVDTGEACDAGFDNSQDADAACRTDCSPRRCGDGVLDTGEDCDLGNANAQDPDAPCRTDCTPKRCGDGVTDSGEGCDEGADNAQDPDAACRLDCTSQRCGDGVLDSGEDCDEGGQNAQAPDAACRTDCSPQRCGDGVIDTGEACDDGPNNSDEIDSFCATDCSGRNCIAAPDEDRDGDGVTATDGDCADCDPNRSPAQYDFVERDGNGNPLPLEQQVDNDCSGSPALADGDGLCDHEAGLTLDTDDPTLAAAAMDLCPAPVAGASYGLVEARWRQINGAQPPAGSATYPLGHGIFGSFGSNVTPQRGQRMLALSTGAARLPSDPGFMPVVAADKAYASTFPPGFPADTPSCMMGTDGYDSIALELVLRAPDNATGFSFAYKAYFGDFPSAVCTEYSDQFLALMPLNPPPGSLNGDIAISPSQGYPISLNGVSQEGMMEVCTPQSAGGYNFPCPLGTADLAGTGFEDHGATDWWRAEAAVTPGELFLLRLGVADVRDPNGATTVLLDDFQWQRCLSAGEACTTSAACCQECDTVLGQCAACSGQGDACTADDNCCGQFLCDETSGRCVTCLAGGTTCVADAECCSGECDPQSGTCTTAPCTVSCPDGCCEDDTCYSAGEMSTSHCHAGTPNTHCRACASAEVCSWIQGCAATGCEYHLGFPCDDPSLVCSPGEMHLSDQDLCIPTPAQVLDPEADCSAVGLASGDFCAPASICTGLFGGSGCTDLCMVSEGAFGTQSHPDCRDATATCTDLSGGGLPFGYCL